LFNNNMTMKEKNYMYPEKKRLAKAITLAIAGTVLSVGAISGASASSTTMYNTFITTDQTKTDGWVYGFNAAGTNSTRAIAYNSSNPQAYTAGGAVSGGFYGTDAANPAGYSAILPFGYGGTSTVNWALKLTSAGDAAQISQADALSRYGYAAEIDTGGGAWRDDGSITGGIPTGWKHQTDIGLIESDVTQNVTLNLSNLNSNFARFGITVFDGMDTKTGAYVHHGSWNNAAMPQIGGVPGQAAHPYNMDNPFATIGLTHIGYSDNVDSINAFTFTAEAGKVYSVYLGGVDFASWRAGLANYQLNVATSPVPVPGAVWLFGTAIAGLGVFNRKKKTTVAS
jgi:hypothetical protein